MDKVTTMEALGHLIRAARLAQGFTHELPNARGFSPKFIYQVEAGKPTTQKVLGLSKGAPVTVRIGDVDRLFRAGSADAVMESTDSGELTGEHFP